MNTWNCDRCGTTDQQDADHNLCSVCFDEFEAAQCDSCGGTWGDHDDDCNE